MSADAERPRLEALWIRGRPTPQERKVIERALEQLAASERGARRASVWLRASRGNALRLGMYDYRDRFEPADAWRLSVRFPPGGREYVGLEGRGDAR